MTRRSAISAFLAAPSARRRLALEAGCELLRARVLTLCPATVYSASLGRLVEGDDPEAVLLADTRRDEAAEIGRVVASVGGRLPFRAECLQQAIAVRRMLRRREISATVYLGIARDRGDRAEARQAAHAWVKVGTRVVSGDGMLEKFAIVARFA